MRKRSRGRGRSGRVSVGLDLGRRKGEKPVLSSPQSEADQEPVPGRGWQPKGM